MIIRNIDMKKIFFKFMVLFAAITMIVGCAKNNLTYETEGQLQTLTITSPSGNAETRIVTTENEGDALGFKVEWEKGDKLIASSADGDTYIATFEILKASDIAADGSAKFTALDASKTLTIGTEYKFYTRDYHYSDYSYNKIMTYPTEETWRDVDDMNFNVSTTLHSPNPIEFGSDAIVLEHFYTYIELTAELPSRSYDVRIRYHDSDNSRDYSYYYMTSGTGYAAPSSTFVFNAAVAPANLDATNPMIVDCSDDNGSTYTELFRIASDETLVAGKHYRIKKAPAVGFPSDAVPVVSVISGRSKKPIMIEIPTSGWPINEGNKDKLSASTFFIGHSKTGSNLTAKYKVFEDVTWSTSEDVYPFSRNPYLSITRNDSGSVELALRMDLPTKKTITITATAPNGATKSFKVNLESVLPVTSVSLNKSTLSLVEGETEALVATINPSNATNKNITWKSSNTAVATAENGVVKAIKAGTTTITITSEDGSKKATCAVTVEAKTIDTDGDGLDDFIHEQL